MKDNHYEHIDEVRIGDIVYFENIIYHVLKKTSGYHVEVEPIIVLTDNAFFTNKNPCYNIFRLTKLSLLDLCNIRLKLDNIINELAQHNSGE